MKKLLAATLTFMMLAPTSVQAKGKMVNVVTKIGKDTVTYNKDGLLTGNNYFSIQYKNGKITSLKNIDGTFHITYRNGRVDTVNKHKVKVAYKSMKYYDENMKIRTSPKGTLYTFDQNKMFGEAGYLFNKKGQLLVSHISYTDSCYRYDAKGYVIKGVQFELASGADPFVFTSKNTYKGSILVSRTIKGNTRDEYITHDKITYKKLRVKDVKTVKKQQRLLLLNNGDSLAYIF